MYAKVTSLGVTGLAGYIVQVEADLSGGLPQFNLVGLPDSAVKESSERVRSAIKNLHYEWPASRITINLAPADVRKTGPVYDLPVFVGIMAAQGKLPAPGSERAFLGELGLHVEILFNEFQYVPAFAVSSILVMMAIVILVIRSLIEHRGKRDI